MVFTPYGERLEPETVRAVFRLEYDGPLSIVFQHTPQTGNAHEDILAQYQLGRDIFLASNADYLLIVESDIIPPRDTITKLMALGADAAYGVYVFRNTPVVNIFEKYSPTAKNQGSSLSLSPHKLRRAVKAQRTECTGAGLGCVLIKRHVLKLIDFRLAPSAHCDTWFNRDIFHQKMTQMADMSVVCGHKRADGVILWPEYATDAQKRV
jgi:hypothetical protein